MRVTSSLIVFHTLRREFHVDREYFILRETAHEVEIQLCGEGGERAVLTLSGKNEIHAPGLAGFVGGTIWRRSGTPDVGQE